jgi:hypothetical protein
LRALIQQSRIKMRTWKRLYVTMITLFVGVCLYWLLSYKPRPAVVEKPEPTSDDLPSQPTRVTFEHFELIQDGMTAADVKKLMGAPPGDYGPGETWPLAEIGGLHFFDQEAWHQGDLSVCVWYDKNGRVFEKRINARQYDKLLEKLKKTNQK